MAINLSDETRKRLIPSIKRYVAENMDEEIGDLGAGLLLDFFATELGPSVYNAAIADAQARMGACVGDLEGTCYEPEFGYWNPPSVGDVVRGRGIAFSRRTYALWEHFLT